MAFFMIVFFIKAFFTICFFLNGVYYDDFIKGVFLNTGYYCFYYVFAMAFFMIALLTKAFFIYFFMITSAFCETYLEHMVHSW